MQYKKITAVCADINTKHINKWCGQNVEFLDAFAKLRKATTSFMSARLSAWNNSAPIGQVSSFFSHSSKRIQVSLKQDRNNGHFT